MLDLSLDHLGLQLEPTRAGEWDDNARIVKEGLESVVRRCGTGSLGICSLSKYEMGTPNSVVIHTELQKLNYPDCRSAKQKLQILVDTHKLIVGMF
jgi:hypothetical protein